MAFFKNIVNATPGEWVRLTYPGDPVFTSPSNDPLPVALSPGIRFYYDEDGNGEWQGPYLAGGEIGLLDGFLIFDVLAGGPGEDVFAWAEINGERHHVTVSARSGDINEDIVLREITVRLTEADGSVIEGAKVEIRLVGSADSDTAGTISQGVFTRKTNGEGTATFALWANSGHTSKTVYEIRSKHPKTGKMIHTGQQFVVGNANADIEDLIDIVN